MADYDSLKSLWPGLISPSARDLWVQNYERYWGKLEQKIDLVRSSRLLKTKGRLHVFSAYNFVYDRILAHRRHEEDLRAMDSTLSSDPVRDAPVVILGTPGIGKSVFLLYLAARFMTERTPFFLFDGRVYYAVTPNGVLKASDLPMEVQPLFEATANTPLLLDIDSATSLPNEVVLRSSYFFLVQAASPWPDNYKWSKQHLGRAVFVMNPHPEDEIVTVLQSMARLKSETEIRLAYNAFGPSIRSVWEALVSPADPEETIKSAVEALAVGDVKNLVGAITTTYQTHQLVRSVCTKPMAPGAYGTDPVVHMIANPTVMRCLFGRWSQLDSLEILDMLRRFSRLPHTPTSGGWLYEAWGHSKMCTAVSFPLHRMIKSGSGVLRPAQDVTETVTVPTLQSATFRHAKDIDQVNTYYIPVAANHPTFDAYCNLGDDVCAFQMTLAATHSLKPAGLDILKSLMNRSQSVNKRFIFVIPKGRQFAFKPQVKTPADLTFWVLYVDIDSSAKEAVENAFIESDVAEESDVLDAMDEDE